MLEKIFIKVGAELVGPFANSSSAFYEREKIGGEIVRLVVEV